MDRGQFWSLIEAAKAATGGDCRALTAQLVAALSKRSVNEVLAWDRIHGGLLAESYRRDLWGAAYLINGGCSVGCLPPACWPLGSPGAGGAAGAAMPRGQAR